ncbi:penicillin-binding protein 2D [Abditibacteriota bacterium]|nr:penicillin-binding protein 2D [Abditibacteriota bacterium]
MARSAPIVPVPLTANGAAAAPMSLPRFRHTFWWYVKWFFIALQAIVFCALIFAAVILKGVNDELHTVVPDLRLLLAKDRAAPSRIYASDGSLLAEFKTQERRWIPIDELKTYKTVNGRVTQTQGRLMAATLSIEDSRFYTHPGVDAKRIVGALIANYKAGGVSQGGSTITEQLAKNVYLSRARTTKRRLSTALIAVQLERKLSKDEILEAYLNDIFYGNRAYGCEAAAQTYFGKRTKDLSISEAALLAGLPQSPSNLDPWRHFDRAKKRQRVVLHEMLQTSRITYPQYLDAIKDPSIEVALQNSRERARRERSTVPHWKSPYFVAYVRQYLKKQYGYDLDQPGLIVRTSIDPKLQSIAEGVMEYQVSRHGATLQGALVSIDPWTGQIIAMVGGRDYYNTSMNGQFNRAVQGKRQPGSTMKPYIYATAMEAGLTPDTVMVDSPLFVCGDSECSASRRSRRRGGREIRDYDRTHHGAMPLRSALAMSNNVIATRLLLRVGIQNAIQKAHLMGVQSSLVPVPTLALGTSEVSLLEHVSAYGVFATKGLRAEATPILKVENGAGEVLVDQTGPVRAARVLSQNAANEMYSMLRYNVTNGTGRPVQIPGIELIGKTGTTSSNKDVWFMGASPQLVTGVWMGYDRPRALGYGSAGGKWCGPAFREFMRQALPIWTARRPVEKLVEDARATAQRRFVAQQYKQYIKVRICNESGLLATKECPDTHMEVFSAAGGAPTQYCPIHGRNPVEQRRLSEGRAPGRDDDLGGVPVRRSTDNSDNDDTGDGDSNTETGDIPNARHGAVDEQGRSGEDPNTAARREYERDKNSDDAGDAPAHEGDGVVTLDGDSGTTPRRRSGGGGQVLPDNDTPQTLDGFDDTARNQ